MTRARRRAAALAAALWLAVPVGTVLAQGSGAESAGAMQPAPVAGPEAPVDPQGWRVARWGMDEAALAAAFGEALAQLPGRWRFGGAYADRALFDVTFAGLEFTAYFQMNEDSHRLQQVLLERRNRSSLGPSYLSVIDTLEALYGPPDAFCSVNPPGRSPVIVQASWRFPTTAIHASLLDFVTTGIAYEDMNRDFDVLDLHRDRRTVVRRFLPRRVLIRFHPAGREDLWPRPPCPPEEGTP